MKKKIVIIGAGYSGTLTAKALEKKLRNKDVEIKLIDKNPFHTMLTELHEVAAGRIDESGIRLSLNKIFQGRKVQVVCDKVSEVDFKNQFVIGENEKYSYDYLVLSAGSRPNYFGIPGAEEFTYSLWSYEGAVKLNQQINAMFHKAQCTRDPEMRKKLLTFWVIGAGFSGVEMISELAEYIPVLCDKYEINPEEVTLYNVDGLARVIPNLSEKLSAKAEKKLKNLGVKVLLNTKVSGVEVDSISLKVGDEIQRHDAGTVIWTAGTQSEEVTQQASCNLECCRGRVQVDEYLRSVDDKKVYSVGDNMYYIPEGEKNPTLQMVENCEQSSHVAAHNLICDLLGHGKMQAYKPQFHGVMVSIGSRDGVAQVGLPGHYMSLSGFLAIAAKHFINVIYFLQVLGWNKVSRYLMDEIFTIRKGRSLVGGHFSNRTPSFLTVPLRVWLGIVWLLVGVNGTNVYFNGFHNEYLGVLEVILGFCLVSGLCTTFSAIVTLVLQIIFLVVSGGNAGNIWMIMACIAVMFGGGNVFGLDYFVKPNVKKWWKRIPFVRKWYLYQD